MKKSRHRRVNPVVQGTKLISGLHVTLHMEETCSKRPQCSQPHGLRSLHHFYTQTHCVLSLRHQPGASLSQGAEANMPLHIKNQKCWEFTSLWEGWGCINTSTPLPLTTTLRYNLHCLHGFPVELSKVTLTLITHPSQPPSPAISNSFNPLPAFSGKTSPKTHFHMNPFLRMLPGNTN